jgi:hypothetical protein
LIRVETSPKGETIGDWDEATQTLTFEASHDDVQSTMWMKLIGNDAVKWGGTWKDKEGQILLDMEGSATRKNE